MAYTTFARTKWQATICLFCLLFVIQVKDSHGGLTDLSAIRLAQTLRASNVTEPSRNYTIRDIAKQNDSVIQVTILNLALAPGDLLTFYDGNYSQIIEQYTSLSAPPSISVTSTLPTAHIEFTANTSNTEYFRSFAFLYRTVQNGSCSPIFYGQSGRVISRKHLGNLSCGYIIKQATSRRIFLTFDQLNIPMGDKIVIWEMWSYLEPRRPLLNLTHKDNGKFKYFITSDPGALLLQFSTTSSFNVSYQGYKEGMIVPFSGESGEITSPNYPYQYPGNLVITYTIDVPIGRTILLTLSELRVSPPYAEDYLEVYGFSGIKNEVLRLYDNSSETNSLTFVSISNFLEVRFVSSHKFSKIHLPMERFKAFYSTLETVPKPCPQPNLNFVQTSTNVSYEGWQQAFSCVSGYANKNDRKTRNVIGVCMSNGSWTYQRELTCLRQCKPLVSLYNLTRRGLYIFFEHEQARLAGDKVTFICQNHTHYEVDSSRTITCTSSGNYSSPPPFCTEKEEYNYSSSKSWIIGVVFGSGFGAIYICVFVVLVWRYYSLRVKLRNRTPANGGGGVCDLEEGSPMRNSIEPATFKN